MVGRWSKHAAWLSVLITMTVVVAMALANRPDEEQWSDWITVDGSGGAIQYRYKFYGTGLGTRPFIEYMGPKKQKKYPITITSTYLNDNGTEGDPSELNTWVTLGDDGRAQGTATFAIILKISLR